VRQAPFGAGAQPRRAQGVRCCWWFSPWQPPPPPFCLVFDYFVKERKLKNLVITRDELADLKKAK
jgi:hypothetical protein